MREQATTSPAAAYEILPEMLNLRPPGHETAFPHAAGARHGFEALIAKRGRQDNRSSAQASFAPKKALAPGDSTATPALQIGVAKSAEHIAATDELVRTRYSWRGYGLESVEHRDRSDEHADSSDDITFFAAERAAMLGTIALRLDGPKGLRAEATYGDVLKYARADGRRLGELTRLALAEDADSKLVLSSLFGLVYAVGRWVHGVTDVFIEVNPRHVAFYARALGFAIVGEARYCERVHAPSILLYADVDSLEERLGLAATAAVAELEPMIRFS